MFYIECHQKYTYVQSARLPYIKFNQSAKKKNIQDVQ